MYSRTVLTVSVTVVHTSKHGVGPHVSVLPHYPPSTKCSRGSHSHASATAGRTRSIQTATSRQIEHNLAMRLEHLTSQDLGEEVSWVGLARHVVYLHNTSTAQLTHLEQLTIDVHTCGMHVASTLS